MSNNSQAVLPGRAHKRHGMSRTMRETSVIFKRNGRTATIPLSENDFERLAEILNDMWWGARAMEAMKEGTIGVRKSEALLKKLLHEKG